MFKQVFLFCNTFYWNLKKNNKKTLLKNKIKQIVITLTI